MTTEHEGTVGWLNYIGQVGPSSHRCFRQAQNGLAVALDLLSTHSEGGPVLDGDGNYLGYINVFDVMRALDRGMDLLEVRAQDIMRRDLAPATEATPVNEALERMEANGVVSLPVERSGKIVYSVKCHDMLRARVALRQGHEHGFTIPHPDSTTKKE